MSDKIGLSPAFPFEEIKERARGLPSEWTNYPGMSIRQFACLMAMQGFIACDTDEIENIADYAIDCADAVLAREVETRK